MKFIQSLYPFPIMVKYNSYDINIVFCYKSIVVENLFNFCNDSPLFPYEILYVSGKYFSPFIKIPWRKVEWHETFSIVVAFAKYGGGNDT